jgi:hypothetical protein
MLLPRKFLLTLIFVIGIILAFVKLSFAQDITITQNTTWPQGTYTYDNVQITNNAVLTFSGKVSLSVQNLTIDSGTMISSDGQGYAPDFRTFEKMVKKGGESRVNIRNMFSKGCPDIKIRVCLSEERKIKVVQQVFR